MTTTAPATSLEHVLLYVEPVIRSALDRLNTRNRLVAGYQLGYWDAAGTPTTTSGKGLRPALALLSARATGARVQMGVPAAAAVEMAHNFSLLHDDVMDGDTERRHRATAWAVFGTGPAILAGDALVVLADELLASAPGGSPAARRLRADLQQLIAGQAADLEFERRDDVTLEQCLQMAADKTAALTSCACTLGALLCDAPAGLIPGLSRFGTHLGMAFQLVDDLLGIWGDPRRTGKPVGADLRARKKTVPVVWALNSGTGAGERVAELYCSLRPLTDDEVTTTAQLVAQTGAREWVSQRADDELATALAELRRLDLAEDVGGELAELATLSAARDH